jgi:hypothetical protein
MNKSSSDHALAAVKAALSLVPIVGGSVASLIGDYIPMSTQRSLEVAVGELEVELRRLGDRVDAEAIDREQFADLFKTCYLVLIRTHHDAKRKAAVRLIANALLVDGDTAKLTHTESDYFASCLDSLSSGALEVLGHALRIRVDRGLTDRDHNQRIALDDLHHRLPQTEPSLLLGLVGELSMLNLLHLAGVPQVRVQGNLYGNYPIEFTAIGTKFGATLLHG